MLIFLLLLPLSVFANETSLICEFTDINTMGTPKRFIQESFTGSFEREGSLEVTSIESYRYKMKISEEESFLKVECDQNNNWQLKTFRSLVEAPMGDGSFMCFTAQRKTLSVRCIWNTRVDVDQSAKDLNLKSDLYEYDLAPKSQGVQTEE